MKKLMTCMLVASMLVTTPAAARHDREHRQRDRGGCGWLCGAIIGGVVVGAIASGNRDRREREEREYDNRYYPPDHRQDRRYCVREQVTEWYRGERYVYWETRCN